MTWYLLTIFFHSLKLLHPCLIFTTSQMCLLCFCLKGFAFALPLSPKSNLCLIPVSAQILTPWTNLTLTTCLKQHFCCSLSHYTILRFFHCHLSQLFNGCILKLFFIICFAHFNVRSMWAVVALFTLVPESLEQCLNIAGSQKLLLMKHNDDDDTSGTLSSSKQCHHRGVSTLTR